MATDLVQEPPALRRSIGLLQATAMVVGVVIGASIFVQPSEIAKHVPSEAGIFGVWLAAGLLTFAGALVAAELSSAFPQTGGVYVFLKQAFSPAIGFLWGWGMFWCMHSGVVAAIATVFARYAGYFVHADKTGVRLIAIGTILALSAVNCLGVRQGSALQTAFTAGKVLVIGVVATAAFVLKPAVPVSAPTPAAVGGFTWHDFTVAIVAGLFAFGGWQ